MTDTSVEKLVEQRKKNCEYAGYQGDPFMDAIVITDGQDEKQLAMEIDNAILYGFMPKKIVTREEYKVMVRPCGLTEYFLEDARPRLIAISHPDLDQDEERVLISSIEEQGFNIVVVSSYDEQYHYFGGAGDMWRDNYKADYVWLGWPDKKIECRTYPVLNLTECR